MPSPAACINNDDAPAHEAAFQQAEQLIESRAEEIAAVIIEPLVQGAAGMLMYPPVYLKRLSELCRARDVLLIIDEVFTGYGRTGTFLAQHQAGINGDIVCLAKGFSGGVLPMAGTVATERVFEAFLGSAEKTLWYGHSFTGNPLGCAVALATLEVFRDENLIEKSTAKGELIQKKLDELSRFSFVRNARRCGIIAAFTLANRDGSDQNNYLDDAGWRFYEAAKQRGALLRPLGNVVYFSLPLTITEDEINELFAIVESSLTAVFGAAQ
jgi:adenosylmethionine-8-amino-7-oxononanoate aminotransferase